MLTRDELQEALRPMWLTQHPDVRGKLDIWAAVAEYAIAHFAPASRIAGMTVEEIFQNFLVPFEPINGPIRNMCDTLRIVANIAHRLAREPAVDRDVKLGREILEGANKKLPEGRPGLTYNDEFARAVGRAVAAQKEERA